MSGTRGRDQYIFFLSSHTFISGIMQTLSSYEWLTSLSTMTGQSNLDLKELYHLLPAEVRLNHGGNTTRY